MKLWKGNGNTASLKFSQKRLEILHQERRGQVNTIVMEHFNNILFYKSEPSNKQYTYRSVSFYNSSLYPNMYHLTTLNDIIIIMFVVIRRILIALQKPPEYLMLEITSLGMN